MAKRQRLSSQQLEALPGKRIVKRLVSHVISFGRISVVQVCRKEIHSTQDSLGRLQRTHSFVASNLISLNLHCLLLKYKPLEPQPVVTAYGYDASSSRRNTSSKPHLKQSYLGFLSRVTTDIKSTGASLRTPSTASIPFSLPCPLFPEHVSSFSSEGGRISFDPYL